LTNEKVKEMRLLHAEGHSRHELARIYGVCRKTVSLILAGKAWKHVLP
jgi:DNA-binding XRE family transcriptional regulator